MEFSNVLFFDTETTGTVEKGLNWWEHFTKFPHVVQLAWIFGDKEESHIIKPDGWDIPDKAIAIHGITNEIANAKGEPFSLVIDRFISDCQKAEFICGHNIHFDTSIVKAKILHLLGQEYFDSFNVEMALYKGKRIDTMRSSIKFVDARKINGGVKFPNLEELYARCFPGKTFPAHDALEDCKAVKACLPILLSKGLVELKLKEYNEPQTKAENAQNCPTIEQNQSDDKGIDLQKISDLRANSAKITEMLNQNDF